jgi:hypothetical protein
MPAKAVKSLHARGGRLGRVRGLSRASKPLQLGRHVREVLELGAAQALAFRFRGNRQGIPVLGVLNHLGAVLVLITGFINTKRQACCTGLILQKFSGPVIPVGVENGPPTPSLEPSTLEESIGAQVLTADLK